VVVEEDSVQSGHADGMDLVVISGSVSETTAVGWGMHQVRVPIVCLKPTVYQSLGMTNALLVRRSSSPAARRA